MLRLAIGIVWCCLAAMATYGKEPPPSGQPNVIIIFVDDQGYYDLGCYGATEFETPQIDKLAAEGIRFTSYYAAAPICSPSRAGLLTGCYPRRVGLEAWVQRADSPHGIHPDELTIAELFRDHGYQTACIGKWHLGFKKPFLPKAQGFGKYFGLLHNLDPVETIYFEKFGGVPLLDGDQVVMRPARPEVLTERYTDEAIKFIRANQDRPFFLYLSHTMLHNPLGVSKKFQGSSQFGEYGDAIQELDHNVGRLVQTLQDLKTSSDQPLSEKTYIVYASDNGRGPGRSPSQPLQGRKLSTYEAGIRVPCIVKGPGLVSGITSDEIVTAMDWYPTLATLAEIQVPEGPILDGRDLSRLLRGTCQSTSDLTWIPEDNCNLPSRREFRIAEEWSSLFTKEEYVNAFFYHGAQGALAAVRSDQWKLVLNPSIKLYDLKADPGEQKPVRNGPVLRKLRGMAITFQEEMRDSARPVGHFQE